MDPQKTPLTNEQYAETRQATGNRSDESGIEMPELPEQLGRYRIRGTLGRGGFAKVLLAHDEDLDRLVALKVPRRERFRTNESLQSFLAEAKMAAGLRHPGIVTIYDVGVEDTIPYLVLEYIRGRTLSQFLRQESLSHANAARLICDVADAMSHAHAEGFVHRDLKPTNILLDNDDRPHISDFGLALRHRDVEDVSTKLVGTPHYMAPEQATGENHRIDERTDIFALGIVFYEMLCRRMPFVGDSLRQLLDRIILCEFDPPGDVDGTVPAELERICVRCLSRRMSERYRHAHELVNDLNLWLRFAEGGSASDGPSSRNRPVALDRSDVPVVPRGLRSFEPGDADFFVRLLPGPRDREGLPATLRFWKHAVEQPDPEQTFRVGLLYGPSGCGKSSLVKAGLIPRLDSAVTTIYLDASASHLERRLQRAVYRRFRGLPRDGDLGDTLFELREGEQLHEGEKVLLVIDQFEQWLTRNPTDPSASMVQALRQCDGGKLQCLLLVRDDFWLPIRRFLDLLEVDIVDGTNAMLIDSFDADHASRVLRELGVAYGTLPAMAGALSDEQSGFLDRSVVELTEEGRLYPVRLSLFAEMVRDRPWKLETLQQMGGADGIGVAFLDRTVGTHASAARRSHMTAARNVLSALLPTRGVIKEIVVSRGDLKKVSGYEETPKSFEKLMHLLDTELRLISPVVADEMDSQSGDSVSGNEINLEPRYQLTHDFLVPSIRDWLERDLRSSREGRLQLMLQDQAKWWQSRPSSRMLPSTLEWIQYELRTNRKDWTGAQRAMLAAAGRRAGKRALMVTCFLAVAVMAGTLIFRQVNRYQRAEHAQILFSGLQEVEIEEVPNRIDELRQYRDLVAAQLSALFHDEGQPVAKRVRAAMASVPDDPDAIGSLVQWVVSGQVPASDFFIVRASLGNDAEVAIGSLDRLLRSDELDSVARMRAAASMAALAPERLPAYDIAEELAATMLQQPFSDATVWTDALKPIAGELLPPLTELMGTTSELEPARIGVRAMNAYAGSDDWAVAEMLIDCDDARFRAITEQLRLRGSRSLDWVRQAISSVETEAVRGSSTEENLTARTNLALAALVLGDPQPMLRMTSRKTEPRVRTHVIAGLNSRRVELPRLQRLIYENVDDPDFCGALLLGAHSYTGMPMSQRQRREWLTFLRGVYVNSSDGELHAASGLLLRSWQVNTNPIDDQMRRESHDPDRDWFVDLHGQTMIVIRPQASDQSGKTSRPFAISANEVPIALFKMHRPAQRASSGLRLAGPTVPVTELLQIEISGFCNWLSREADIEDGQWCYPPLEEMTLVRCLPHPDFQDRLGYRLPTVEEWQIASRCLSGSGFLDDVAPRIAQAYAWTRLGSGMKLQLAAERLPSPRGLFDLYGNASEYCVAPAAVVEGNAKAAFFSRGGSVLGTMKTVLDQPSDEPERPQKRSVYGGFRVVRTLPE